MATVTAEKYKNYLTFVDKPVRPGQITRKWSVHGAADADTLLGYIVWYAPWRRYVYKSPHAGVVFDAICLSEVQAFLDEQMVLLAQPTYEPKTKTEPPKTKT